jgi:hypothetical protein
MRALALAALLLLAGCSSPAPGPSGPTQIFRIDETTTATDPSMPGVELTVHASGAGRTFAMAMQLRNGGTKDLLVQQSCSTPFVEGMKRGDEAVAVRAYKQGCTAPSTVTLKAGQTMSGTLAWNATIAEGHPWASAPAGTYTWTLLVRAYANPADPETKTLRTDFTLILL